MSVFRIIIAGGRKFNNYSFLKKKMDIILKNITDEIIIVSGTASGADKLGENYAAERNYKVHKYQADWENMDAVPCTAKKDKNSRIYNALAGHNRNEKMANNADALVAFHDGVSTGTANMIQLAKNKGLKVRVILYK